MLRKKYLGNDWNNS